MIQPFAAVTIDICINRNKRYPAINFRQDIFNIA